MSEKGGPSMAENSAKARVKCEHYKFGVWRGHSVPLNRVSDVQP